MIDPNCSRCRDILRRGRQTYSVEGELGQYVFDVELALRIVNDGKHPTAEVPTGMLRRMLLVNAEHHAAHLDHVDPSRPGIIGQRFGGICLIDGNHRAHRCLRDGLPFRAYLLDLAESMKCLIHSDPINFTPELMAREIRGMLKNNPECQMLTTELTLTDGEDSQETETTLRSHLTPQENARWTIRFQGKKGERACD
jgi:hypothetical protein